MKTRYSPIIHQMELLLILLLIMKVPVNSQDYIPFNFESGIWLMYSIIKESNQYHFQYYCNGDTIIEGKYYHKLYEYKVVFPLFTPPYVQQGYYGAIANDTTNKKVLLIEANHNDIIVIYNFDLEVGDTIKEGYGSEEYIYPPFVVQEIDTLEICGRYHRRYIIDKDISWGRYEYVAYIEGI